MSLTCSMPRTTATPVAGSRSRTERMAWLDALLVLGLSFAFLRLLPDSFSVYDEGTLADTAERVYRGEVLYRDVFAYWNPGGFWLGALLFKLAGVSVQTLRISLAVFGAAAAVGVWRLARDHTGRILAVLAGLCAPLVCYPVWYEASSHWYSTFTGIAAAVALTRCFSGRHMSLAVFTTGVLCAITFIMLQPVGAFLSAAIGIALVWDGAWALAPRAAAKRLALLAFGALVPIAAMYGYFAFKGALGAMLYDTILFNLHNYRSTLHADYGYSGPWPRADRPFLLTRKSLMLVPPSAYLLALALAVARYVRGKFVEEDRRLLALAATGAGLLASNYYYPDAVHLAFAAPPAFATLAVLLARLGSTRWGRLPEHAGSTLLLLLLLFAGAGYLRHYRSQYTAEFRTPRGTIAVPPVLVPHFQEVFAYFEGHLPRGNPFYVYPYGAGYNFLFVRPNPTRYAAVFPNVPGLTTEQDLAEVVSALEHKQVRYILVNPILYGRGFLERNNTILERYIRRYYHVAKDTPPSSLFLERDSPGNRGEKIHYHAYRR